MDIEIDGLTPKQKAYCEVMWGIDSIEGVVAFIKSLPQSDQKTCTTLLKLMQYAMLDEVTDVTEAKDLLSQF